MYVLFDEIQHLRDWEVHLKALVDAYPHVRFVASGSAAAALKFKSRESGAGRFTDFLLPPLTFHEYVALRQRTAELFSDEADGGYRAVSLSDVNDEFIRYLNFGGYPELALNPDVQRDPGRFVKEDVIDKVLLRDLPSLYGIQDIQELNSLFTMLAFNTGGEISLEALAQRSHVAKNTLKRYIEYLKAAFLIKVVHRVDHSARRFQRAKAFKVFLTNPSMYGALFTPVTADDQVTPRLVETAVFAQWFHSPQATYYARWDGGEVDLVWVSGVQKVAAAVEVKWSDRAFQNPGELKALIAFANRHELDFPVVTTRATSGVKTVDRLRLAYLPASVYSYIVGNVLVSRRSDEVHDVVRELAQDPRAIAQSSLPL